MSVLLQISRLIDALNERIGRLVSWLVLITVLISATNAVVRKALNISSNAFLEVQWYFFSAIFLLGAAYTLLRQEHVRIDVVSGRFSKRTQIGIDIFGILFFLFPFVAVVIDLSIPVFWRAWVSGEMSSNAGGLVRWPVYLLVPVGFTLLGLQGVSELIKRIAFLQGRIDDPTEKKKAKTAEEELAEFVRAQQEGQEGARK